MNCYLLVDFGSTFTKLTLIEKEKGTITAQAKSPTTINTSVMVGFDNAYKKLLSEINEKVIVERSVCCSSAAGGLKIVVIGITPSYTLEAAKRVAMGAGGRIVGSFSYLLSEKEIEEIKNLSPDLILLTGGTEGGNKTYILQNAKTIVKSNLTIPLIVAGNSYATDELKEILNNYTKVYFTENIMPDTDKINPTKANSLIREIFMNRIVSAKGMDEAIEKIGQVIMPTPTAVLKAANLLAVGTDKTKGIGEIVIVDVGGATTDVHSISEPIKNKNHFQDGLEETFVKRSVEGDLGMRYSVEGVMQISKNEELQSENALEIYEKIKENPFYVSKDKKAVDFDTSVAKECVKIAVERHSGETRRKYINGNYLTYQEGKDLTQIKYVIGTGGVIINSERQSEIIDSIKETDTHKLIPKNFEARIDKKYILSAMGLLSVIDEEMALKIMLENIL